MSYIFALFAFSILFNVLLFIPAFRYKTDKLTDLSYSLTFIFLALAGYALSSKSVLHTVLLVAVLIWALRLGSFLFSRIRNIKCDKRFDGMREVFTKFLSFWLLQGLTVPVVLLAAALAWHSEVGAFGGITVIGLVVFAAGLLTEATADYQKSKFNKVNKGKKWIDTGIWRISRHPNYLGEILVWIGVYLIAFSSLDGTNRLLGLVSPLYIMGLLLFVSGVPLLEKAADAKWGTDKDYQRYKKEVPVLIPSPRSVSRLKT